MPVWAQIFTPLLAALLAAGLGLAAGAYATRAENRRHDGDREDRGLTEFVKFLRDENKGLREFNSAMLSETRRCKESLDAFVKRDQVQSSLLQRMEAAWDAQLLREGISLFTDEYDECVEESAWPRTWRRELYG